MTRPLQELVSAWTASTTERERADIEHEMREHAPNNPGARKSYCGYWITAQLPPGSSAAGPRHIMDRAILRNVGAAAEPIWDALDAKKLTLRSSGVIIARARDDGQPPTAERVTANIAAYLAGTLDIKRPSETGGTPRTSKRRSTQTTERQAAAKERNSEFYEAVEKLFDQMLVGVPPFEASRIREVGKADLRALTETWAHIIARARSADPTEQITELSRTKQLYAAMRVLHVDPPKDGVFTAKVRASIKTSFRRLARLYHPDKTNNNPSMTEEYRKVVEAHSCIQALLPPPQ